MHLFERENEQKQNYADRFSFSIVNMINFQICIEFVNIDWMLSHIFVNDDDDDDDMQGHGFKENLVSISNRWINW